ncbi:MAG: spore coat protein U domain-containing protein [Sphingomonadaceae bacterium]|nr:spore coat protein U domain-containing protein [Sphingomonadaceae bacterium]
MKKHIAYGITALAALASATSAYAGTATGTLTSTLNVTTTCTIGGGGAGGVAGALLDFGTVPAGTLTTPLDADTGVGAGATLNVNCDGTASAPTLAIGATPNLAGGLRAMSTTVGGATSLVPFSLFFDSGRTTEYPINTPVTLPDFTTGNNVVTVYGRVAAGTAIPVQGLYSGDATLTLTF